jgi:GMP synthase (glutamine-hydrolysing)
MKILLIQLRKDLYTKQEEYLRFLVTGHLRPAQMDVWDVFHEVGLETKKLDQYDAVFMGGSSDDPDHEIYFTEKEYPFVPGVLSAIRHIRATGKPFFASCMGFHMVNQALGGEVVIDVSGRESGVYDFVLNEEGKKDPLFQGVPEVFPVVSYHKKRAVKIPEGMVNLGSTDQCPYHVIRDKDKPFYAFQFHPELDKDTVIRWSRRYAKKYFLTEEFIKEMEENFQSTAIASSLIGRFLEQNILGE